jgi:hypothetical protein
MITAVDTSILLDILVPNETLKTAWQSLREKAGVQGRWRDNPHTLITHLAESGASAHSYAARRNGAPAKVPTVGRKSGYQMRKEAKFLKNLAPQSGLEPETLRLTAECSTIELLRSICNSHVARCAWRTCETSV